MGGGVGVLGLVVAVVIFLLPPVSTSTTMLTTKLPYDCNAGFANWQAGWSEPKKVFCCHHIGKGCAPPPPAPAPYDCNAGFANWQAGWSEPKKSWCCQHQGKGCAATPCPTTR